MKKMSCKNTKQLTRGSAHTRGVEFKNKDGTPRDMTGYEAYITIRSDLTMDDIDDTTAIIDKQFSFTNASLGLADIVIGRSETENVTPGTYRAVISVKNLTKPVDQQYTETLNSFTVIINNDTNKVI